MGNKPKGQETLQPIGDSGIADELSRFQDGLAFINAVRADLSNHGQSETSGKDETIRVENDCDYKERNTPLSVGRFDIRNEIGKGGFATVFLAFDPVLNRDVAVKILNNGTRSSRESIARFEREAQVAAALSHPNIVPVFDSGICNEVPYIVSEYCKGESLEFWLTRQDGPIDCRLAAAIVAKIAAAIEYAHQRGVIHRDIKPANVLIEDSQTANSICDRLRVADFGLAKFVEKSDPLQTTEGAIVGTPAFMSPEQAEGSPVTRASDIYSMGVVLYQLLTGDVPHRAETHLKTLYSVSNEQPKRPRQINRLVPPALEAICLKCLSKRPDQRYSSAFDFASDLDAWLTNRPVSVALPNALQQGLMWCRRNPVFSITSLLLAFILTFAAVQWHYSTLNKILADAQSQRALGYRNDLTELVDEILNNQSLVRNRSSIAEHHLQLLEDALNLQIKLIAEESLDSFPTAKSLAMYRRVTKIYELLGDNEAAHNTRNQVIVRMDQFGNPPNLESEMLKDWFELQLDHALDLYNANHNWKALERLDFVENVVGRFPPIVGEQFRTYCNSLIYIHRSLFQDEKSTNELTNVANLSDVEELLLSNDDFPLKNMLLIAERLLEESTQQRAMDHQGRSNTIAELLDESIRKMLLRNPDDIRLRTLALAVANEYILVRQELLKNDPDNLELRISLLDYIRYADSLSIEPAAMRIEFLSLADHLLLNDLKTTQNYRIAVSKIFLRKADLFRELFLVKEEGLVLDENLKLFENYPLPDDSGYMKHAAIAWRRKILHSRFAESRDETLDLVQRCHSQFDSLFSSLSEKEIIDEPFYRLWLTMQQKTAWINAELGNWESAFVATERLMDFEIVPAIQTRSYNSYLAAAAKGKTVEIWLSKNGEPSDTIMFEQDRMLELLEFVAEKNQLSMKQLEHPRFQSLRSSPRFNALKKLILSN